MNDFISVALQESAIGSGPSPAPIGRKIVICLLAMLTIVVMMAWLGFLGWGTFEVLCSLTADIKKLWTAIL